MADHPGIERLLRLLIMLSGGFGYSIWEIADRLEMSEEWIKKVRDHECLFDGWVSSFDGFKFILCDSD